MTPFQMRQIGTVMKEKRGKGIFVVIEGIDGTGKSTLAAGIQQVLRGRGIDCLCTFEPTEGRWGSMLRKSFSGRKRLSPDEELELFIKDRREHVENEILPAIESGKSVICDRYYFSTMAYQGARGMDMQEIKRLNEEFAPVPDIVFLLALPPDLAVKRITRGRGESLNNFEEEEYLRRVAENFDSMHDDFIIRLNAASSREELLENAMKYIDALL